MADQLRMLEDAAASAAEVTSLGDVPLVVISSADQTPDVTASHHVLARMSSQGHVVLASKSGHWVPYDEPELIVETIREVVETVRPPRRQHVMSSAGPDSCLQVHNFDLRSAHYRPCAHAQMPAPG
jgi:hypothetical protein